MNDNKSAFDAENYNKKIRQTLPYYNEFYKQVIDLVNTVKLSEINWLDVGCGTGEMGRIVYDNNMDIKRFVSCDSSVDMIRRAEKRLDDTNMEFHVCDILNMKYNNEFDVITAIQVNHYLSEEERKIALKKCYDALKDTGIMVNFENIAPFTEMGKCITLEKWKDYQIKQGKGIEESEQHIKRYGKDYFPISILEHLEIMRKCGFEVVEMLWYSNMQAGFWGMKKRSDLL